MHLLRDGGSREQSQGGGQDVYIYMYISKYWRSFFLSSAFLPKNIFNDWSNLETYPILEYIIYK